MSEVVNLSEYRREKNEQERIQYHLLRAAFWHEIGELHPLRADEAQERREAELRAIGMLRHGLRQSHD